MQRRRDTLLSIGELFTSEDKLRGALGKDTYMDLAIYSYAVLADKMSMLASVYNVAELADDVKHIEEHYDLLSKRNQIKEDLT